MYPTPQIPEARRDDVFGAEKANMPFLPFRISEGHWLTALAFCGPRSMATSL
jgi:hypothetical protein